MGIYDGSIYDDKYNNNQGGIFSGLNKLADLGLKGSQIYSNIKGANNNFSDPNPIANSVRNYAGNVDLNKKPTFMQKIQDGWNNVDNTTKSAFLNQLTSGFEVPQVQQTPIQLSNVDYSWAFQPTQMRGYYNG